MLQSLKLNEKKKENSDERARAAVIYTGYKFHFALIKGQTVFTGMSSIPERRRGARGALIIFPRLIKGVYETRTAATRTGCTGLRGLRGLAPYANESSEARRASL